MPETALSEALPAPVSSAARAAPRGADEPRVIALVDVEGPADRFSLVPPGAADNPLAALDPWDDTAWAGREAAAMIPAFGGSYLRVQAEDDHVHGPHAWHARRMVEAARDGRCNAGDGALLPGRVSAHGATILTWIGGIVDAAPRAAAAPPRPPR